MAQRAFAPALRGKGGRDCRSYRFTFLDHPDDDRALAALVMVADCERTARELAYELLNKSQARCVEVWCDGDLILRAMRPAAQAI